MKDRESLNRRTVYITGHRNPDMDSVCSAAAYAYLKNRIDPTARYQPIRSGRLNRQTRFVFERLEQEPPALVADLSPKVIDIAKRNIVTLDEGDPILHAIRELDQRTLSVLPVFEKEHRFKGLVTIHEIADFLIDENTEERPSYQFRIDNFKKVVPGYFYQRGSREQISAPLMTGAMPYEVSLQRIQDLAPVKPVLVVGLREDILTYAVAQKFPVIIITGMEEDHRLPIDVADYGGTIFVSHADTAETIRLLRLSAPVGDIMNREPLALEADTPFDEAKKILTESSYRGLPVMEKGRFAGIVTRRCFIEKPARDLILVDHNELDQSTPGADEARIIEILDHHRIDTFKTAEPIYIYASPLGSTCTIVYKHFLHYKQEIPAGIALMLLSGILSDTVILKSPTTTEEDRQAAGDLAERAGVDLQEYGRELFSYSSALKRDNARQNILGDFKTYHEGHLSMGVGQVEVTTLGNAEELREAYIEELKKVQKSRSLDWILLMVTDVIKEDSLLLVSPYPEAEKRLYYKRLAEGLYHLPGILSRKKQLLPELLRVASELSE